jgi:hypothetical protein
MKKIFTNPEVEIMLLCADDVITTSDASGAENAAGANETPDW